MEYFCWVSWLIFFQATYVFKGVSWLMTNSFALREHGFSQISHHLILGWCFDAENRIKFEAFTGFMWKQMGFFLVFPDWFGVLENRSETLLQFAFRCLWTAERPGSLFLFSLCQADIDIWTLWDHYVIDGRYQSLILQFVGQSLIILIHIDTWTSVIMIPSVWPALSGRWKWTAERSVHFSGHSRCHVVKIRQALQISVDLSWSKLV